MEQQRSINDWWVYVLAAVCGMAAGAVDVAMDDLLLTALVVVASGILLGILRPLRPWRWVIAVGVFIPLTEVAAYFLLTVKTTRAQIYASCLIFLPGIAGAYGGAVFRNVVSTLRQGK